MANAEFWRKLAAEFRALPDDHGMFRLDWDIIESRLNWRPFGRAATRIQFEGVCKRAGFAVNPQSLNYLLTWLEGLRVRTTFRPELTSGSIVNPATLSAEVCEFYLDRELQKQAALPSPPPPIAETGTRTLLPQSSLDAIHKAHLTAESIQWKARDAITSGGIDAGSARAQKLRSNANFKAAQTVLRVAAKGYEELGLSSDDFQRCMKDEIEAAVNSLELNQSQERLLTLELLHGVTPERTPAEALNREHKGRLQITQAPPAPSVSAQRAKNLTLSDQLNAIRLELELSYEEVAEGVNIDPTNVSRHMTGKAKPSRLNRPKYAE